MSSEKSPKKRIETKIKKIDFDGKTFEYRKESGSQIPSGRYPIAGEDTGLGRPFSSGSRLPDDR